MKKLIPILFTLMILSGVGLVFWLIPFSDIHSLKSGSVHTAYDENSSMVSYSIKKKKSKSWFSLQSIPKEVQGAFIVSEDWSFFEHPGIDVNQLKEAVIEAAKGERVRGASTISQQLVKNLWLTSEKSLIRKIKEVPITLYMENVLGKKRILEIYLNIIQFGKGLYGIGPAADYYFEKSPSELTAEEGAFLAMLLPNPIKYSQSFREKELTDYAQATIESILHKMKVAGYIDQVRIEALRLKNLFINPFNEKSVLTPETLFYEEDEYFNE